MGGPPLTDRAAGARGGDGPFGDQSAHMSGLPPRVNFMAGVAMFRVAPAGTCPTFRPRATRYIEEPIQHRHSKNYAAIRRGASNGTSAGRSSACTTSVDCYHRRACLRRRDRVEEHPPRARGRTRIGNRVGGQRFHNGYRGASCLGRSGRCRVRAPPITIGSSGRPVPHYRRADHPFRCRLSHTPSSSFSLPWERIDSALTCYFGAWLPDLFMYWAHRGSKTVFGDPATHDRSLISTPWLAVAWESWFIQKGVRGG